MASLVDMLIFNIFHFFGPGDLGLPPAFWIGALVFVIAASYIMKHREKFSDVIPA